MGNTHHKKKAQGTKTKPLWHFDIGRSDKQKKAASKLDDDARWSVLYKPSPYQHQQENIFLPSTRPAHIEDLHKEAEIGLKSLQEQGTLDGYNQPHLRNGHDCSDDCNLQSQDADVPVVEKSGSCAPNDEVWAKTRSLPPPTPDEIRKDMLSARSGAIPTGTTFKPQPHQKAQSSFKGPKLKEKRIRRTTIMGLPQHVQQELGLGKSSRSVKAPGADSAGVVDVSRGDGNGCFKNGSRSKARGSLRSVNFTISSEGGNESLSTLKLNGQQNWGRIDFSQRPMSLAIPKSSIPSELLQSPVMSMSPQATYLSKIIPNAILPAAVDVVMINTSHNCLRALSRTSLVCAPSPACSRSISLQHYDGKGYASSDAWSHSQSSETIVSNNSTISSQGNTGIARDNSCADTGREKARDEHNVTNSAADHHASTRRWVSECAAQNASAIVKDTPAHHDSTCKTNALNGNGYDGQALSPAQSTSSIVDASDTLSITSERSITRSLSVRKMKRPPAPPRRMHSLQGEEQSAELKGQSSPEAHDDVFFPLLTETNIMCGSRTDSPAGAGCLASPLVNHKLSTAEDATGATSKGRILQPSNNFPPQNPTSPNKSERTMSPSSGYSSQSGTPTLVRSLVPPSSPAGKPRPRAPERSSSLVSPEISHSSSLASIASSISEHVDLFAIPPPPSSPAPPPPTARIGKLPPSPPYTWAPAVIPPPPTGPAPLPPTKKPSFLFKVPFNFTATTRAPPVTTSVSTVSPPLTKSVSPPVTTSVSTVSPPVTTSVSPPVTTSVSTEPPPVTTSVSTVTPPVIKSVTPPVTTSVTPPVITSVTPPVITSVTPPVIKSVTPPVIKSVTPPVIKSVTPPVTTSVSTVIPPVTKSVIPPVIKSVTPPVTTSVSTVSPPVTISVTSTVTISAPTVAPSVTASASTVTPPITMSAPTVASPITISVAPPVTTSVSTVAPPVTTSVSTVAPPVTTSVSTVAPPVTTSVSTVAPPVTTSVSTVAPPVTTSVSTVAPPVTTSVSTVAPPVTTSVSTVAPPVTTSVSTVAPPVTTSAPTVAPPVTTLAPTVAPPVTILAPTVAPPVTGTLVADLAAPSAPQVTSTSVTTPVSAAPPMQVRQELNPLQTKVTSPPSPPPSHHPPPPPKKTVVIGKISPPSTLTVSEPTKQERSPLDWPPPPPPLSPSNFAPSSPTETSSSSQSEKTNVSHSLQREDAEFLFPPPPPSLLADPAREKRFSAGGPQLDVQPVPPPAAPPLPPDPGQSVAAALSSPPLPPLQPPGSKTPSVPKPLLSPVPSPAMPTPKPLQQKLQVDSGSPPTADSQLPKTMAQTPKAPNQDSAKELPVESSAAQDGGQASIPIVTPSLLQMVRLRSVQMSTYAPGVPDSKHPVSKNQPDLTLPATKSNVTAPNKPARKSLSLRLSSSSDSEPSIKPSDSPSLKTPTIGVKGQTALKSPDDCAPHKSPASTASFIFSKNVHPTKLLFETPRSPEAEAEAKKNFMAELSSVSGRIASKTESKSSASPQSKAVLAAPSAPRKHGRIPPPVAKKPSFLPSAQRLPSTSTVVRVLPPAEEKSDALKATSDTQDEKGKLETGNGELAGCKGD